MAQQTGSASRSNSTPDGWARLHLWQVQAVRDLVVLAIVLTLVWAGYALRAVTIPLLVALLLAYLFEPLVAWLCRRLQVARPIVVGSLLATGGLLAVLVLALVIPMVVGEATRLVGGVVRGDLRAALIRLEQRVPATYRPQYRDAVDLLPGPPNGDQPGVVVPPEPADAEASSDSATVDSPGVIEIRPRSTTDQPPRQGSPLAPGLQADWLRLARGGAGAIVAALGAVIALGLLVFLIPFYFYFFSVSYPAVLNFGRDLIPQRHRPRVVNLLMKMDRAVAGFVRGRIVVCLVMGLLLAVGWMICGVPYAFVLGLVIGVFCIVPYLGGVGVPIAVALLWFRHLDLPAAEQWPWWAIILWPTVVFAIVQLIENYILTPIITGKATNLDPVTILVAVLAGGSVMGMYGMLLAIPAAACGKILITDVLLPRVRDWSAGRAADPLPIDRMS